MYNSNLCKDDNENNGNVMCTH